MNRVENINLSNFRAFEGEINLDFKLDTGEIADVVIIHAPNGVGKTSIFDAVEWGLTGCVHRLDETIETQCKGNILKNRNINEDTEAYVQIECESGDKVIRKTNRRSQNTDYNKGTIVDGRALTEYNDWKAMILPHSRIDGFVAASSPEEKFEEWGKLWDSEGKSKDTFSFISGLKKHTDKKKVKLEREVKELQDIVESIKIEESKYNEINSTIDIINNNSDKSLRRMSDVLDYEALYNLQVEVIEIIEKLKVEIMTLDDDVIKVMTLKGKMDNYQKNLQIINRYKSELELINSKISSMKRYLTDEQKINDNNIKILRIKNEVAELNSLLDAGTQWIDAWVNHSQMVKIFELNEIRLSNLKKDLVLCNDKVDSYRKDKNNFDKKIINLENIYSSFKEKLGDLNYNEALIKKETSYLLELEQESKRIDSRCFELKNRLNNINKLALNENDDVLENIMEYVEECDLDKFELVLIYETSKVIRNNKERLSELENKQKVIEKSISIHEKIVIDAVNWIEENNSSTCPVCHAKYDDYESLLKKVSNNFNENLLKDDNNSKINIIKSDINDMEKMLINQKAKWNNKIDNIKTSILYELESWFLKLEEKRKEISDLKDVIESRKKEIDITKVYYYRHGVTEESIISSQIINEWHTLESNSLLQELKNLDKNIEQVNKTISSLNKDIAELTLKNLELTKKNEDYNSSLVNNRINELYKKYEINYSIKVVTEMIGIKEEELENLHKVNNKLIDELKAETKITESDFKLINQEKAELINTYTICSEYNGEYKESYFEIIKNENVAEEELNKKKSLCEKSKTEKINLMIKFTSLKEIINSVEVDSTLIKKQSELELKAEEKRKIDEVQIKINELFNFVKDKFKSSVSETFNNVLSNDIFSKIEAHPIMNRIEFDIDLSDSGLPQLKIVVSDKDNLDQYLPEWYFSSAQLNALALSMFLSKAISKRDAPLSTIFIDDPIGNFDDINMISFVDVIRSINEGANFQVVLSTHDESIYKLLKMKLSSDYYKSKFIELTELIQNSGHEICI